MGKKVEDLGDHSKYRQILSVPYDELVPFIFDYLKRISPVTIFFWSACLISLGIAVRIRVDIASLFTTRAILFHSVLGLIIFPVICIPFHEGLHVIPYYLSGARNIRAGMDLKQYLFYVTAHRYVAGPVQFRIVAAFPFLLITCALGILVFTLPGLWKWSLSIFLFVHTTMCAGDFALLNFYHLHKGRNIYTWDDADLKIAYFYEEI